MKERWLSFFRRYRHALLLLYFVVYLQWFYYLERTVRPEHWIHSWMDDLIPFQEIFVIPYLMWFLYVAVAVGFFLKKSPEDYYRLCAFLFVGMTLCLLIYTFFPNGHHLRPWSFQRNNVFVDLVRFIYSVDTCTNVDPSIHVLNSIGVHIAVWRSPLLKKHRGVRIGSLVLCVLICMSTVFLKQHSVEDVISACILAVPLYIMAYRVDWAGVVQNWKSRRTQRPRLRADR